MEGLPDGTPSKARGVEGLRDQNLTAAMRNDSSIPICLARSMPSVEPSPCWAQRDLRLTNRFSPTVNLRAPGLEGRARDPRAPEQARDMLCARAWRVLRLFIESDLRERRSVLFRWPGSGRV